MMPLIPPAVKRHAPLVLFILFSIVFWIIMGWRSAFFSNAPDAYQYSAPFALQRSFLNFSIPLIGDYRPFSQGWGYQWPFYMIFKSGLYSLVPYSPALDKLLTLAIVSAGGMLLFAGISRLYHKPYLGLLCAIAYMMDEFILATAESTRAEPLTALLLLGILFAAESLATGQRVVKSLWFLGLAFFLLPGLHPHGLTLAGGLAVLHVWVFRRWNPGGARLHAYLPVAAYALGILAFLAWFKVFPAAGEQMRINMQVQKLIYASATRFTYFTNYIPGYRFLSGYFLWGGALVLSLWTATRFAGSFLDAKRVMERPIVVYASAIVIAVPVLGFIFQIDNYGHFCLGVPAAIVMLASFPAVCRVGETVTDRWRIPVLGYLTLCGIVVLAGRGTRYVKMGCPDLAAEQKAILTQYAGASTVYVPQCWWEGAVAVRPETARMFRFPLPMLREFRKRYEDGIYADAKPGDILLVEPPPATDRLQYQPVGQFYPPDPNVWEFVRRHQRPAPWDWDISAYRRK